MHRVFIFTATSSMAALLHRKPASIGKSHDSNKTDAEYYKKTHMMFPHVSAACYPSWKTVSVCQVCFQLYVVKQAPETDAIA
jgi:hypothetical protein